MASASDKQRMKKSKTAPRSEHADLQSDPYDFVRYMRGQGHSFATIARDVRLWFEHDPNRRITGPELREWYDSQTSLRPRRPISFAAQKKPQR